MSYQYAIVIVTYNRLKMLKLCLEHAMHQTLPAQDIIVVDNASTDGTGEYLRSLKRSGGTEDGLPRLHIFHTKKNIGGAGGFHYGLKAALRCSQADWFLLIDDDAVLDYDCCEKMGPGGEKSAPGSQEKDTADTLVYACAVYRSGEVELSHRKDEHGPIAADRYRTEKEISCTSVTFCGSMFHRRLVEQIGYPLKEYFIWFDDAEYSMRAEKLTRLVLCTQASLQHGDPDVPDRTAVNDWRYYYGTRNKLDMLRRHKKYGSYLTFAAEAAAIVLLRRMRQVIHMSDRERAGQDGYEAVIFSDGLRDGLTGRLGINQKHLPGSR